MIAGFIETSDNQTVLLASGLASGKEHRQYMIDGFTDTAGPKICSWQGAEAVYDQWVHGYCWPQDLLIHLFLENLSVHYEVYNLIILSWWERNHHFYMKALYHSKVYSYTTTTAFSSCLIHSTPSCSIDYTSNTLELT